MKNCFLSLILLAVLSGCVDHTSRRNHKYTLRREQGLYIEVYKAGIMGRLTSEYLTDSLTFRVRIGTFDDKKKQIHCRINGDQIQVQERERMKAEDQQWGTMVIGSTKTYSLGQLRKTDPIEK